MAGFNSWPLQQALFARLGADTGVQALIGNPVRLYDHVPQNPTFPYVTLGEEFSTDWGAKGLAGQDVDLILHAWSRYRGKAQAKQILGAIHTCLHEADFAVSGANLVLCRFAFSDVIDDPDGLTRHGIIRFRIVLHA